jgi:hypothetical protein
MKNGYPVMIIRHIPAPAIGAVMMIYFPFAGKNPTIYRV